MFRINNEVCLLKYADKDYNVAFKSTEEGKTKFAYITIRRMIKCKM